MCVATSVLLGVEYVVWFVYFTYDMHVCGEARERSIWQTLFQFFAYSVGTSVLFLIGRLTASVSDDVSGLAIGAAAAKGIQLVWAHSCIGKEKMQAASMSYGGM